MPVRIRSTELTEALGFAGKEGEVYGQSIPSSSGVEVIGTMCDDFAINVWFDDLEQQFWFAAELVVPAVGTPEPLGDRNTGIGERSGSEVAQPPVHEASPRLERERHAPEIFDLFRRYFD